MAFPVPSHLPRKKNDDVSTKLLTEISETAIKSLSQEVASKWVAELDVAIRQTKEEIHKRVHSELPAFDQQLSSSKYVQERLLALETNVDNLSSTLSHPETGLVPNLISTLTRHAALAQELIDAEVMHQAMSHLAHCKREMQSLASLVEQGRLPDAVALCLSLERLLATSPQPLPTTEVMHDVQRRFRALKDRTDEQLHEAYSRVIVVSANELIVRPSVQVRASDTVLSLSDVLTSLSPPSLNSLANTLRRDLTSHYIDYLLSQPASVEQSSVKHLTGVSELKLELFPSPPNTEQRTARMDNISTVLSFLNENLFPYFPAEAKLSISLAKPLTSAVLNKLLIPALPSSVTELPTFLALMERAVTFEEQFIIGLLGTERGEKLIKSWADGVVGHYERTRRVTLLESARAIILRDEDDTSTFRVEAVTATSRPAATEVPSAQQDRAASPEEAAWGFDGDADAETSPAADDGGWGFDDDDDAGEVPLVVEPEPALPKESEDPGDAWGWNDEDKGGEATTGDGDGDESTDSSAWDDPWGDVSETAPAPTPAPTTTTKAAKTASRLERLSNKGKSTKTEPTIQSPIPVAPPPPTPAMPSSIPKKSAPQQPHDTKEIEFYVVSGRMKELMSLVQDILHEAADLTSSGVLSAYIMNTSQVGGTLGPTSASILDLYRALYPVHAASKLTNSAKGPIIFSNNCTWLGGEVKRAASGGNVPKSASDKLMECAERLEEVGGLWYEDAIDGQCQKVNDTLNEAQGFINTTDQNQYDECEAAVNQSLQNIRRFAQQVKPVMRKSKYYGAVGNVVDAALSRILGDVLALEDITADESNKLSELCRIMNSLEGLFVENPDQPSFVVDYVPSWFKFSYLSELLEASIADISYLFEEGALVDFSIEELTNLVRALFADTPLRTNTINKLMQGHPPVQT